MSSIFGNPRRGSIAGSLRWLVRSVGGKQARETAERVAEEKQRPAADPKK